MVLQRHTVKRKVIYDNARTNIDPVYHTSPLFRLLPGVVSHIAVRKVAKQLDAIQPDMAPCSGAFTTVLGLLCKHFLQQRLTEQGSYARLLPSEFHKHWFFDADADPAHPPILQIQDPDVVERRRTRRRGLAECSTQRGLTAAEIEDQRLARPRLSETRDQPRGQTRQRQTSKTKEKQLS